MKLSALRKSQPVELELDDKGSVITIFVKEMTGAQRDEYFNKTQGKTKVDASGQVIGIKDYKGLFSSLLSVCVYDNDGKQISEDVIQSWPDSTQRALFELAQTLNNMNRTEEESKN